jgi:hypothetical protein
MIASILLFILVIALGILFYLLHMRVEKLSKNQVQFVEWCDTLMKNQETLLDDMKKLRYELQKLEKESRQLRAS